VFGGVDVKVAVMEGMGIAACVCAEEAPAVCAITVLMLFGSNGGTGVTIAGAHAMIKTMAIKQKKSRFPGFVILADPFNCRYSLCNDFLHTPDQPILQTDLNAVRMFRGFGKYILYNTLG
jgi:hypothetical protein